MAKLIILSGKHKGKQIVIPAREILIGRDEGCFIRLFSSEISRQHCALRGTAEGILVRDLGSSNGTFVNDDRISGEVLLTAGDTLRVGQASFEVPYPPPSRPAQKMDDDIVEWLSDDDTRTGAAKGMDTTILTSAAAKNLEAARNQEAAAEQKARGRSAAAETGDTPAPAADSKAAKRPRREFRTLAEEAADIIRRHFESLQAEDRS